MPMYVATNSKKVNGAKTKDVYVAYRKAGYSKKFFEAHREEITLHKAAKEAFSNLPDKKIPRVKELNAEYAEVLEKKKSAYAEYRQAKKDMQDYVMATLVDIEAKDIERINKLFEDAILVDNELLNKMDEQLKKVNVDNEKSDGHSWDASIITMFDPHIETLFSYELPEDFSLKEGEYFSFLDVVFDGNLEKFKETFRWSNAYLWLLNVLKSNEGCIYFGELSQKLHNALISDPKPFRRDVKQMLANLLLLIEQLGMEEIVIDRPNYSQRVMLPFI